MSPFGWFFTSRKGLLTLFTLIVALIFAVLVGVKVAQDKLSLDAGLAFIGGGLLGWFAIAFKAIDAIAKEDAAAKTGSPPTIPPMAVIMLSLAIGLAGCAGSFEEARLVGLKTAPPLAKAAAADRLADKRAFCLDVDRARRNWSAAAKASTVAAGAEGLAMIPLDRRWEPYIVGTIAFTGILGAYCYVQADSLGALWARECST